MYRDYITYMFYNGKNIDVFTDLIRKGYRVGIVIKEDRKHCIKQLTLPF